jgi:predicted AAA+ superfamily ATPase
MKYIKRLVESKIREELEKPEILIILGPRQVGKTTLVKQLVAEYGGEMLNMDILTDKEKLMAISKLDPIKLDSIFISGKLLAIDEVQRVPEISHLVKGWYDAGLKRKIILLGSSSLDLLDKFAESLTGRNNKIFLLPLNWREILSDQSWFTPDLIKNQNLALPVLHQSIVYGGYPAVYTHEDRKSYLSNLTADYLLKDVYTSGLVKSAEVVKKLASLLAYQVGNEVSVLELATNLGISRLTVEKYIEILERSFVIFSLPSFGTNPRKEITKSKKIYFWDTGVRNALIDQMQPTTIRTDIGQVWENWVVAEVAKKYLSPLGLPLFFWRTKSGSEVDLIVKTGSEFEAFEIKWSDKKQKVGQAFANQYKKEVKIINPMTFIDGIL